VLTISWCHSYIQIGIWSINWFFNYTVRKFYWCWITDSSQVNSRSEYFCVTEIKKNISPWGIIILTKPRLAEKWKIHALRWREREGLHENIQVRLKCGQLTRVDNILLVLYKLRVYVHYSHNNYYIKYSVHPSPD